MNKKKVFRYTFTLLIIVILMITSKVSNAQFYNGLHMDFGKNRVQYKEFYWQYYRFNRYDTYFYVGGDDLAKQTSTIINEELPEIEKTFDYTFSNRVIFIVYNKLSDFRQSNIGLDSEDSQYNIGGVTKIIGNKVFIYFEGDHNKIKQQIKAALAEVIINEMLYGDDFKNKLANSTLLTLPEWYIKGLISYASNNWDENIDNKVKDGIINGKYDEFNRLSGEDAIYAGHSIWNYIANKYGKSVIPNIVYLTRVSKSVESGFMFVLGTNLKFLSYEWLNYYDQVYFSDNEKHDFPNDGQLIKRPKKEHKYQQIKISPDGNKIIYTTNILGKYKVWLYDTEKNKHKKILRKEHKLDQITDYSYPLLAWHPTGELFTIITEEKGKVLMRYYFLENKKIETRELFYFEKILDFSYSHDGKRMVMSAVQNGQTDIYVHTLASHTNEQITNDYEDDFSPKFINNSTEIVFSSNRVSDTLQFSRDYNIETNYNKDIFIYNYKTKSPILTRISNTENTNEASPNIIDNNRYTYLSNENGIINRHVALYDSTISYIDTTTHYRYFTKSYPITNYSRNIIENDISISNNKYAEILFHKNKYKIFVNELNTSKNSYGGDYINTRFKKKTDEEKRVLDSLNSIPEKKEILIPEAIDITPQEILEDVDTVIDINNFVFEKEKKQVIKTVVSDTTTSSTTEKEAFVIPRKRVYFTNFYINYVVNQVDFGFLNSSYQPFTGGEYYFNPNFNLLFKIGTSDLFEDYKIVGGFRFAGNFDSNEFLVSIENLKKRLDKQLVLHRQTYTTPETFTDIRKTNIHEAIYILKYPLSQVLSVNGAANIRNDKTIFLSIDDKSLNTPSIFETWGGIKLEVVFDNTRNKGINLYNGGRFKIFGEVFQQFDNDKDNLFVIGADFRHYQKIHKNLIWANRFATSTSFGKSLLIYYLGSTDNWINLSPSKNQTFNRDIRVDPDKNYSYQALATNMRGFTQNIRNGNSFAVFNSELRWPVIKYFSNKPINSDFLANMQIVGFTDIGTAWSGKSPFDRDDAYNYDIIEQNPITVTIDKNRDPIVFGYGFGVRSKLLGYFIRADWAWGVENGVVLPRVFYLSLSLDF